VLTFILRRLLLVPLVLLGVVTIVFFALRVSGDPVALFVTDETPAERVAEIRRELGFDAPVLIQYGQFLMRVVQLDLGNSLVYGAPVVEVVLERLPATLLLAVAALLVTPLIAVPIGVLAALKRNSVWDQGIMTIALIGQSMPVFWTGIVLMILFAVVLGWLPTSGSGSWRHVVLPAATLGIYNTARVARLVRSAMLEVLSQDYVRTARAKGLGEFLVVMRHAFRNAAITVITILGLTVATLMGGAVVTETVFSWPGIGSTLVRGIGVRDYPLVQGTVLAIAVIVTLLNLLIDLLYALANPRVRL